MVVLWQDKGYLGAQQQVECWLERVLSMDENSGDIDWQALPREERPAMTIRLYAALSGVAKAQRITITQMFDEAFKGLPEVGTDYGSNFRKGNASAVKAQLMHQWLEVHHFDLARTFAPELFQMNPARAWDRFLRARRVDGGLRIVRMANEFGIAQRAANVRDVCDVLQFGQEFCLELTSDRAGQAIAFQGHRGEWHPLALGNADGCWRVPIVDEAQLMPRDHKGQPIPLVEFDDAGNHSFVIITAPDKDLPLDKPSLASRFEDEALKVFQIDVRFVT